MAAPGQAEIQQHRQAIAVTAHQVGRGQIAMQQVLAMEGCDHGQQLAQQQQHLPGAEHQLAFLAGGEQVLVGGAPQPLAHQPEVVGVAEGRAEAGQLGVEQPLQPPPELAGPLLILIGPDLTKGDGGIGGQLITGQPESPLGNGPIAGGGQRFLQAVTVADQLAGFRDGSAHQRLAASAGARGAATGWCRPRPLSQAWS